jgi:hypothetical protein
MLVAELLSDLNPVQLSTGLRADMSHALKEWWCAGAQRCWRPGWPCLQAQDAMCGHQASAGSGGRVASYVRSSLALPCPLP